MWHSIPPIFLLLYDIALQGFNQGKPSCKTFSFANFLFSQIKKRRNSNRLHIRTYFKRNRQKRSFFRNSIFTLLFFETANEFQDDASEWSATGLVNPMGQISSCRLDSLYISERSSRFARTASMYLSSSASVGLDSLRYIEKEHTVHFA